MKIIITNSFKKDFKDIFIDERFLNTFIKWILDTKLKKMSVDLLNKTYELYD